MKRPRIRVLVMGGLGNQLFQYATALHIASTTSSQVLLDYRFLRLFGVKHQASLTDLPFKDLPQIRIDNDKFILFKKVLVNFLGAVRRISICSYFFRRYLGFYISNKIDEEIDLVGISKPRLILGYFQTKKYIEVLKESIDFPIVPKIVSSAFEENYKLIVENKTIAIHVRLGDYKNETNTIGNLSENYYINAQDVFESFHPSSKYLIFTNDPVYLMQHYTKLLSRECNTLFHPEVKMTDVEEFSLMSACNGHIIANSTYSYWAAALSTNPKMIIRPCKWFKSLSEPQDFFPAEWKISLSEWI